MYSRQAQEKFLLDAQLEIPHNLKYEYTDIRNYLAGRVTGATRDEALIKELIKILFCKIQDENNFLDSHQINFISLENDSDDDVFARVNKLFDIIKNKYPLLYESDSKINLDPRSVRFIVNKLKRYSFLLSKRDPVGDAFEIFIGSQLRGSEGQFFTPRNVIELIVDILDPQPNKLIIDPACGTGGFLSVALNYLKETNQFKDSNNFYNIIEKSIFGIDKDAYLADLAKKHIAIIAGCNPNIICDNSLEKTEKYQFPDMDKYNGQFDIVMTNPPFGSNIDAGSEELRKKYDLAFKWKYNKKSDKWEKTSILSNKVPPQVLFIERCIKLLKCGGKLGIILPESIFSSNSYKYVVNYITTNTKILAIISMPEELFKTTGKSGTHTKTCAVILEKNISNYNNDTVFMAEAKWCGHDSRGIPIPYDDLPEILLRYKHYEKQSLGEYSHLGFKLKLNEIYDNIFIPNYYDPEINEELEKLSGSHELYTIEQLENKGIISISSGDEIGKLAYGTGKIPFIRSSDISNWEIKVDPKHTISEEIYLKFARKQDIRPNDILLVKDGTYLIGTTAIVTEYDTKILLQSHIFKIRIKNYEILNPYMLLALLSSDIVQKQIRSKQFSQDIIDSIGSRFSEVVIPIPIDTAVKNEIIKNVKEIIEAKIRARELLRKLKSTIAKPINTNNN